MKTAPQHLSRIGGKEISPDSIIPNHWRWRSESGWQDCDHDEDQAIQGELIHFAKWAAREALDFSNKSRYYICSIMFALEGKSDEIHPFYWARFERDRLDEDALEKRDLQVQQKLRDALRQLDLQEGELREQIRAVIDARAHIRYAVRAEEWYSLHKYLTTQEIESLCGVSPKNLLEGE